MIKFGNLLRDYKELEAEIDASIKNVLNTGWYILGNEVEAFENEFEKYLDIKHVVTCANGTEAIALALMAVGVSYDDEVITVPNTATPTVSAISMVGAKPVFVDVFEDNLSIDYTKIEEKITKRTKAIIPVDLYGIPAEFDPINRIGEKYNIPIIEDACQAHGSMYKGKKAGTLSDIGCFSFYPSKNLGAYGDGGAVVTNNSDLFSRLMMLRNYGQTKRYYNDIIGINSRLDEVQAAILRVKLKYLDNSNKRRNEIAGIYKKLLDECIVAGLRTDEENYTNYHLYIIRSKKRDKLIEYLNDNSIQTMIHYPINIHLQKAYSFLGYKLGDFPISEKSSCEILSLPMYPQLKMSEAMHICDVINNWGKC